MYNYYTDLKRKEKLEEEKKEIEKEKRLKLIRQKKMKQYSKNYEKRIKKFMYDMAEKPIFLREITKPFTTTREELLFEESDKILFHKGFVFNLYQTDKERLNNYINEKEKEKDYEKKIIVSYDNKDKKNNMNTSNKLYQPQMRFKPRTDLERIYHILSNYRPSKVGKKSKKIIEKHLNKITKVGIDKNGNLSQNYIDDSEKIIEELLVNINKDKEKKKEKEDIEINSKKKNKRGRADNSKAKELHSDLYNKTYFNAVENYSIFKDTCFLPKKINNTVNENNNNFRNTFNEINIKNKNKINKYRIKNRVINNMRNNDFFESESYSRNNINISTPNDLLNFINSSKGNSKEDNVIKSLDNVDLFIQGLKVNKPKLTKKEQVNFDKIKSLAFDNKKKKYLPIIDNNKQNNFNKEENDLFNNSFSNDGNEDYTMKKQEEKIKVNGIEYRKNDLENLSKAIMESCNYTKKKYRDSDNIYSHSGNGKLMFTNGLTVKEFEQKYHINP